MDITRATLDALYTGFKKNYQQGFDKHASSWNRIATEVPSSTAQNTYSWLGDMPGMREWLGDRQIRRFGAHDYTVKNREFEQTVGVKKTAIEDDEYGIYAPMFTALGEAASVWPDEIVYEQLRGGFAANGYDGQFFFDTDHPVYNAEGEQSGTVSNMQAGGGEPWFLMNTKKALKPLIWQLRKSPKALVRLDKEDDQNVFFRKEFIYGNEARGNAGYGFWQMAHGAKTPLTEANFKTGRTAMRSLKDERGRPIANEPDLLVVSVANADAAEALVQTKTLTGGGDNPLYKAVDVLVTPYVY